LTYSSGAYARYKNNTGKTKYIGDWGFHVREQSLLFLLSTFILLLKVQIAHS
jgi:hypothetical protein